MQKIATVKSLHIYPVKSMRGVAVEQASLYWYGVNGDRKYAFVRSGNTSGFPWLTGREVPELLLYQPYFVDPADVFNSAVRVVTPAGGDYAIDSPKLQDELQQAYGHPIHLTRLSRGTFDAMPISLLSETTVANIGNSVNLHLTTQRFRANVILDLHNTHEDEWSDYVLAFGDRPDSAHMRVNYPTRRCVMINLDPHTAERDSRVLKTVGQTRNTCAGVYGAVVKLGTINIGDTIFMT